METTYDIIMMHRTERYAGEMRALAEKHFELRPSCRFVDVWEAGGWHLGYRRDGTIWTTANDAAVLRGEMPTGMGFELGVMDYDGKAVLTYRAGADWARVAGRFLDHAAAGRRGVS